MEKIDLRSFTQAHLTEYIEEIGQPAYRARQLFSWLYKPGIISFSQMTDLSKDLRAVLEEKAYFSSLKPIREEKSRDGAIKYGFELQDGTMIESVLIPEEERLTLCVSSQAGCAMGCRFCLTGSMGFKRNLTPAEIVNQVLAARERTDQINNLVFMGMGEPLANFNNLLTALAVLQDQRGLNFSDRRITVSTSGIVPKIRELGEKSKVNLAVSLHAVDDATRSSLMPINATYPVDTLLEACRQFPLPKRKRIMFEYILLKDINDSAEDAKQLAKKLRNIRCKINLLPYNECPTLPYKRPSEERVTIFQKILWEAGYTVIVRSSRGDDISAACGQLAGSL